MDPYPIPSDALDDRLGIVGTSGAGKTYTAMGAVERLLAADARCVIVDPLDVWWGLRLSADGERASGFDLPILGGAHGDLPLTEHSGALIGETVSGTAESCIISLGGFSSGAAERRFMLAFLNALYRRSAGSLFHLILDEADLWAPQIVLDKEGSSMALKGMVENIVRRGRVKGFVPWLITQRPAVIDKSVMSMMAGLIAMRAMSPQDRAAVDAWLKGQMTAEQRAELTDALPQLAIGEGVVWIPGHNVLQRAQFPLKRTFDSSRAPKRGEELADRQLQPLDLGRLRDRLAVVDAEVKANDPKALRAEVARLQAELNKRAVAAPPPDRKLIERAAAEGYDAGFTAGRDAGRTEGGDAMLARVEQAIDSIRTSGGIHPERSREKAVEAPRAPAAPAAPAIPAPAPAPQPAATAAANGEDRTVTSPQRKLLGAIAWWEMMGKPEPSRAQVSFIAGWSPNSSNVRDRASELARAGMIVYPKPGHYRLTDEGRAEAPAPERSLTLTEGVRRVLTGPQQKLFDVMLGRPEPTHRDQLAEACGWSTDSSNIRDRLSELSRLELIERSGPGVVALQDWVIHG